MTSLKRYFPHEPKDPYEFTMGTICKKCGKELNIEFIADGDLSE
ncbi:MAG: hypothetical protein V3U54_13525 [Thermodesulfobacteriota bacterium]